MNKKQKTHKKTTFRLAVFLATRRTGNTFLPKGGLTTRSTTHLVHSHMSVAVCSWQVWGEVYGDRERTRRY